MNKIIIICIFASILCFSNIYANEQSNNIENVQHNQVIAAASDISEILNKAEEGNPQAQNKLGDYYRLGINVEKNPKTAFKWYKIASKKNFNKALNNMGMCFMTGFGVEKNEVEAVKWFKKGYEAGDITASKNLGNMA